MTYSSVSFRFLTLMRGMAVGEFLLGRVLGMTAICFIAASGTTVDLRQLERSKWVFFPLYYFIKSIFE